MTLLEADIKYRWRCFDMNASSINIGVNDSAVMNTFYASYSGAGCSTGIAYNNFGYNVQVGCIFPVDKLAEYK
jgi:hypothetical protein